ncbi:MAG: hypothetical protein WC962_07555 [Phycisphaerae bacterium]|jgi:hypothetical protein
MKLYYNKRAAYNIPVEALPERGRVCLDIGTNEGAMDFVTDGERVYHLYIDSGGSGYLTSIQEYLFKTIIHNAIWDYPNIIIRTDEITIQHRGGKKVLTRGFVTRQESHCVEDEDDCDRDCDECEHYVTTIRKERTWLDEEGHPESVNWLLHKLVKDAYYKAADDYIELASYACTAQAAKDIKGGKLDKLKRLRAYLNGDYCGVV